MMHARARRAATLVALAPAALLACSEIVHTGDPVRTTVGIDVSALRTSADGRSSAANVLQLVRLTATPDAGAPRTWSMDASDETTITFDVTVPAGNVQFVAEGLSNSGAMLYRGSTAEQIRSSGFMVAIDLQAVNAVLVATPDTIDLRNSPFVEMTIRNAGALPLDWSITTDCDNDVCVIADPAAGRLGPAAQRLVIVRGFSRTGQRTVPLRIASNVGTIEIPVIVPPLPPIRSPVVAIRSMDRAATTVPVHR